MYSFCKPVIYVLCFFPYSKQPGQFTSIIGPIWTKTDRTKQWTRWWCSYMTGWVAYLLDIWLVCCLEQGLRKWWPCHFLCHKISVYSYIICYIPYDFFKSVKCTVNVTWCSLNCCITVVNAYIHDVSSLPIQSYTCMQSSYSLMELI